MEPNSAPDWNDTPNFRRIRSRSAPRAANRSSPSIRTLPLAGRCSPIRCFSTVLLPLPLSPAMTTTSPRRTLKFTSFSTVRFPYAAEKSLTSMIGRSPTSDGRLEEGNDIASNPN